jgi:hypothetical protein
MMFIFAVYLFLSTNTILIDMKRLCVFMLMFLFSVFCSAQQNPGIKVIGRIPDATDNRLYQMQVGSFRVVQNAASALDKLKAASLSPSTEKYQDLTRVMISGVRAFDVPAYIERIRRAGFSEVFIKLDPVNETAVVQPSAAGQQPSAAVQPSVGQQPSAAGWQPSVAAQPSAGQQSSAVVRQPSVVDPWEDFSPGSQSAMWPQYNDSEDDFPRTGLWKLTGLDPAGTEWKADIVITNVRNNNFDGYFDWYMEPNFDYRGKEYFTGRFDNIADKVFFQGTRLENSRNLVLGKYEAYVTTQRDKFYNGRWEEPDGIPRSDWQATLDDK